MPLLTELRGTVRRDVPFIEGGWVDFFDDLTLATVDKAKSIENKANVDANLSILCEQIVDWNFYKTAEEKLPISVGSFKSLPIKVVTWLINEYISIANPKEEAEKKSDSPEIL